MKTPLLIKKCLFPVAGFGTRFLPITKSIPKEMLPILTKPLIHFAIEEALNAGVISMNMVISKNKQIIQNYFEPNEELDEVVKGTKKEEFLNDIHYLSNNCEFSYIKQKGMHGLGHAIYAGKPLIGNHPFAVILPDDLCINDGDSVLLQMSQLKFLFPDCCIVAIQEVPMSSVHKYGVIEGNLIGNTTDLYRVSNMIEKPVQKEAPSNLAIIGRYILNPEIFDVLENTKKDDNGEIQITDALMTLAKQGKVIAYKFKGIRYDCGSIKGYLEANNKLAKQQGII